MSFDIQFFEAQPVGFQGFVCEVSGERVSPAECLACALAGAPGCEYGSPAIIHGITSNMRQPGFSSRLAQAADFGFSATELLTCPRKYHLAQMHPWWDKPSQLYWAFRGTVMHSSAEAYAAVDPLAVAEVRLFADFSLRKHKVAVHGAPDLMRYHPTKNGWEIIDYKTIHEIADLHRHTCPYTDQVIAEMPFPLRGKSITCLWCGEKHASEEIRIERIPFQPRDSHVRQLNIYATLIEANAARLAAMVNAQLAKAGWALTVPPDAPVVGAELHYMSMKRPQREPVAIWPLEEREALIGEHLARILQDDLPPILDDPGDVWQCNYCALRSVCVEAHGGKVGKAALLEQMQTANTFDPQENLKVLGF